MEKYVKSRTEIEQELTDQVQALRSSAAGYDNGNIWEAKRLASSLYILLHDGTGRTKSLLGMLGLKNLPFLSSVPDDILGTSIGAFGGKILFRDATPLLMIRLSSEDACYAPVLGEGPRGRLLKSFSFSKWYEEGLFYPDSRIKLSRKNVIFTARSQDGGAHVDQSISDPSYRDFSVNGDPNIKAFRDTGAQMSPASSGVAIKGGTWAIIRQLTWEIDETLKSAGVA